MEDEGLTRVPSAVCVTVRTVVERFKETSIAGLFEAQGYLRVSRACMPKKIHFLKRRRVKEAAAGFVTSFGAFLHIHGRFAPFRILSCRDWPSRARDTKGHGAANPTSINSSDPSTYFLSYD